jgi:hypothetical protein
MSMPAQPDGYAAVRQPSAPDMSPLPLSQTSPTPSSQILARRRAQEAAAAQPALPPLALPAPRLSSALAHFPSLFTHARINASGKHISVVDPLPRAYQGASELFLAHNSITSLQGLSSSFPCLTALSLAHNCIRAWAELRSLPRTLRHLTLEGNPIAQTGCYRARVVHACAEAGITLESLDGQVVTADDGAAGGGSGGGAAAVLDAHASALHALVHNESRILQLAVVLKLAHVHSELIGRLYQAPAVDGGAGAKSSRHRDGAWGGGRATAGTGPRAAGAFRAPPPPSRPDPEVVLRHWDLLGSCLDDAGRAQLREEVERKAAAYLPPSSGAAAATAGARDDGPTVDRFAAREQRRLRLSQAANVASALKRAAGGGGSLPPPQRRDGGGAPSRRGRSASPAAAVASPRVLPASTPALNLLAVDTARLGPALRDEVSRWGRALGALASVQGAVTAELGVMCRAAAARHERLLRALWDRDPMARVREAEEDAEAARLRRLWEDAAVKGKLARAVARTRTTRQGSAVRLPAPASASAAAEARHLGGSGGGAFSSSSSSSASDGLASASTRSSPGEEGERRPDGTTPPGLFATRGRGGGGGDAALAGGGSRGRRGATTTPAPTPGSRAAAARLRYQAEESRKQLERAGGGTAAAAAAAATAAALQGAESGKSALERLFGGGAGLPSSSSSPRAAAADYGHAAPNAAAEGRRSYSLGPVPQGPSSLAGGAVQDVLRRSESLLASIATAATRRRPEEPRGDRDGDGGGGAATPSLPSSAASSASSSSSGGGAGGSGGSVSGGTTDGEAAMMDLATNRVVARILRSAQKGARPKEGAGTIGEGGGDDAAAQPPPRPLPASPPRVPLAAVSDSGLNSFSAVVGTYTPTRGAPVQPRGGAEAAGAGILGGGGPSPARPPPALSSPLLARTKVPTLTPHQPGVVVPPPSPPGPASGDAATPSDGLSSLPRAQLCSLVRSLAARLRDFQGANEHNARVAAEQLTALHVRAAEAELAATKAGREAEALRRRVRELEERAAGGGGGGGGEGRGPVLATPLSPTRLGGLRGAASSASSFSPSPARKAVGRTATESLPSPPRGGSAAAGTAAAVAAAVAAAPGPGPLSSAAVASQPPALSSSAPATIVKEVYRRQRLARAADACAQSARGRLLRLSLAHWRRALSVERRVAYMEARVRARRALEALRVWRLSGRTVARLEAERSFLRVRDEIAEETGRAAVASATKGRLSPPRQHRTPVSVTTAAAAAAAAAGPAPPAPLSSTLAHGDASLVGLSLALSASRVGGGGRGQGGGGSAGDRTGSSGTAAGHSGAAGSASFLSGVTAGLSVSAVGLAQSGAFLAVVSPPAGGGARARRGANPSPSVSSASAGASSTILQVSAASGVGSSSSFHQRHMTPTDQTSSSSFLAAEEERGGGDASVGAGSTVSTRTADTSLEDALVPSPAGPGAGEDGGGGGGGDLSSVAPHGGADGDGASAVSYLSFHPPEQPAPPPVTSRPGSAFRRTAGAGTARPATAVAAAAAVQQQPQPPGGMRRVPVSTVPPPRPASASTPAGRSVRGTTPVAGRGSGSSCGPSPRGSGKGADEEGEGGGEGDGGRPRSAASSSRPDSRASSGRPTWK